MNTSSRFIVAVHILTALETKARICDHFGREPKITSDMIAESVNTNAVVIRRIVKQLQEAGLVISKTGRTGGTKLAWPAGRITLSEIHRAVEEGELFHMHYSKPNQSCPIGGNIQDAVRDVFDQAYDAMQQVLSTRTVADIADDVIERSGIRAYIDSGMTFDEIRSELEKQASVLLSV